MWNKVYKNKKTSANNILRKKLAEARRFKYAWVMEYACDRIQLDFPVLKCRLICELPEFIIIYELVYSMGLNPNHH